MLNNRQRPIVYLTSGIFGYLYRFLPIGRRLLERGHDVVVVTASSEAATHGRAEGFVVHHLAGQEAAMAAPVAAKWTSPWAPIARYLPGVSLGPRGAARAYWRQRAAAMSDTKELEGVLEALLPALVLTEAEEHRDIRVVRSLGLPLMLFEDLYATRPGRDVPFPARSHQIPSGTATSRLRAAARWQRFFLVEAIRRHAERWWVDGNDWHSALGRLGERADLDSGSFSRRYLQFYDYLDVPRLRTVAPELAFPGEQQPPLVTGPIVDVDRVTHDVDADFEQRWATMLRRRSAGTRIIYVSVGTFLSGLRTLTDQIIEATAELPNVEVVLSAGQDHAAWHGESTPEHVAVFARVPQIEVLAHADLAVTTGGLNTGHEALWFGVPILNLPVAGIDTAGNSARLCLHGVARRLTKDQITVSALAREMALLLADSGYRQRAGAMSVRLRAWDGVSAATSAIESAAHSGYAHR